MGDKERDRRGVGEGHKERQSGGIYKEIGRVWTEREKETEE